MRRLIETSEHPSRRRLLQALAAGALGATPFGPAWGMEILGKVPHRLPPGKSIYDLDGRVLVNGVEATEDTLIQAGDRVESMKDAYAVFVIGRDAFILRENSRLQTSGAGPQLQDMHLESGALLSVFGKHEHRLTTPVASVGIRGTGLYVEAEPDLAYVCTCYGTTELSPADGGESEIVSATHHAPRYVTAAGDRRIREAPFKNHTDLELTLIEALVGRVPPFPAIDDDYGRPRRY